MGKIAEALLADEGDVLERSCRASVQGDSDLLWGPSKGQRTRDAYEAAPRFVLLNFRCNMLSTAQNELKMSWDKAMSRHARDSTMSSGFALQLMLTWVLLAGYGLPGEQW